MSIASRLTRIGFPAAVALLASGLLVACGSTRHVGTYFGPHPDGGVLPTAGAPLPSGNLLSIQCGPFGPSRISRSAIAQSDPQVVVADFNCDGHPDSVTGTSYYDDNAHGSLRLRLGNGDGTFRDGGAIGLGMDAAPVGIATGDFDANGAPDLVVAASRGGGQGALIYYRGSCGQEPWSPQVIDDPTPYLGTDMAVADVNGDAYEDLVVARSVWPNRIDVLLGGGLPFDHVMKSDAFSDATPDGRIRALSVGDFDGDGRPDAAAVTGKALHVLLGTGTGKLMHVAHLSGTGWFAVRAADLDGDGRDEIVTMDRTGLSPTHIDAYDYKHDGGVLASRTLLAMPGAAQLGAGDLDGDGKIDLVVSGPRGVAWPSALLMGNGSQIDLASTKGALRLADVTGDGHTDLVFDASYGLEVFPHLPLCSPPSRTCGSGAQYSAASPAGQTPWEPRLGGVVGKHDFGGHYFTASPSGQTPGEPGLGGVIGQRGYYPKASPVAERPREPGLGGAIGDRGYYPTTSPVEQTPEGPGIGGAIGTRSPGAAYSRVRYPLGQTPRTLLFGDVTGNGAQDVIAVGADTISMLDNDGSGKLTDGPTVQISTTGVAIASIARGAASRIIAVNGSRGWTVIRGDGSMQAIEPAIFPYVTNVVAGNFNGDLQDGLVFQSVHGIEVLPRGEISASFHVDVRASLVRAVDFNYDGYTDLLMAEHVGGGLCVMYGPLTMQSSCNPVLAPRNFVGLGDLNGDGKPEMTFADSADRINLWSQHGGDSQLLVPEYGWRGAHILARASAPAALLVVAKGGALAVYSGNGDGTLGPGGPISVEQSAGPLAYVVTHDLDGDGNDEILGVTRGPEPAVWVMKRCPTSSVIY